MTEIQTRIVDEVAAIDQALNVVAAESSTKKAIRSLRERLTIAKDVKAKGQVRMLEAAIIQTERAFRIEHMNPYPEVTRQMALDAMCEPIKEEPTPEPQPMTGSRLNSFMQYALGSALRDNLKLADFERQLIEHSAMQMANTMNMPRQWIGSPIGVRGQWDQSTESSAFNRKTHKYGLACEILNMTDLAVEGSRDTAVMLPMSALCRLKEAKAKNMFGHFEVWRPSEWKAPDPWLVGVYERQANGAENFLPRYYKVCDWR
jgi:hypothetical protein